LPVDERDAHCHRISEALAWPEKVFYVSAIARIGTQSLCFAVADYLDEHPNVVIPTESNETDPDAIWDL
jgi:GTP-binding protein